MDLLKNPRNKKESPKGSKRPFRMAPKNKQITLSKTKETPLAKRSKLNLALPAPPGSKIAIALPAKFRPGVEGLAASKQHERGQKGKNKTTNI